MLKLLFNSIFVCLNTAICSVLLCLLALIKLFLPVTRMRNLLTHVSNRIMWLWATINFHLINFSSNVEWDIQGGDSLNKDGWYLLIANHMSWTDIVVIFSVFRNRIPMAKFFLKRELLFVPFLGMACWAVDMPFMKRYSRQYLIKNPHKRGHDLATTRRSCARFCHTPTTVVNFVEGTRFNLDKKGKIKSPYQHLLPPKTGGIGYTLNAMGEQFDALIDVTLAYPDNRSSAFQDLLSGKMKKIVVSIDTLPVNDALLGDYFNDKQFKREFHLWLNQLWQQKDHKLQTIYNEKHDELASVNIEKSPQSL